MSSLQNSVLCACCAALALTLAEGILPMERFRNQLRLLLMLLLFTAILRPLVGFSPAELIPQQETLITESGEILENLRTEQEAALAESIRTALENALAERGIDCKILHCIVHIQEDGSIQIIEVQIAGNVQSGTVFLREWLGNDTTITEGG